MRLHEFSSPDIRMYLNNEHARSLTKFIAWPAKEKAPRDVSVLGLASFCSAGDVRMGDVRWSALGDVAH